MKAIVAPILSGLVLAFSLALPMSAAESKASVESVLQKYIQAAGGKAALEKVTAVSITGKIESPSLPAAADWRLHSKAPAKQLMELEIAGFGVTTEGVDGKVAWSKNPLTGVRDKTGGELEKALRDAQFGRELNFQKIYPNLAYKGMETVAGERAHILESAPSAQSKERFAFSEKTGLLIRQESDLETTQGPLTATSFLTDYRAVNGVMVAHHIKVSVKVGGQDMALTFKVSQVDQNKPLPDARFAKPAA